MRKQNWWCFVFPGTEGRVFSLQGEGSAKVIRWYGVGTGLTMLIFG